MTCRNLISKLKYVINSKTFHSPVLLFLFDAINFSSGNADDLCIVGNLCVLNFGSL